MRDRETIEKDVPVDLPGYDENYDIIGHRNNQTLLTAVLEVLLDIRALLVFKDPRSNDEDVKKAE